MDNHPSFPDTGKGMVHQTSVFIIYFDLPFRELLLFVLHHDIILVHIIECS